MTGDAQQPPESGTRPRCAICGADASVRYTNRERQVIWYCGQHVTAPVMEDMPDEEKRECEAFSELMWFSQTHQRTPSLDVAEERELIIRAVGAPLRTKQFERRYPNLMKAARRAAGAKRRIATLSMIYDLGCLSIVLLIAFTLISGIVLGVIWGIRAVSGR